MCHNLNLPVNTAFQMTNLTRNYVNRDLKTVPVTLTNTGPGGQHGHRDGSCASGRLPPRPPDGPLAGVRTRPGRAG